MIAVIAAYAHDRVIGRAGKIPWDIPGEQSRFRELTTGNVVIMGRRTYEEIGRPLPNRDTILVSMTLSVEQEHCTTVPTLAKALELAGGRDVYIAGGEQLYREALPLADILYLTTVEADVEGDRFFPEVDDGQYDIVQEERIDGDIPYAYWTYRRRPMTPTQAQEYVREIAVARGIVLGLGPIRALLARLGNPQNRTKFLHIAGTNGKGSTGAMLCRVLTKAGYRTGQFSSPAVFDPMDPWRIGTQTISPEQYARLMTRIRVQRDAMQREGQPVPTAFELETALAFLYFAEERCDFAVLECGMGGLEDATNVIPTAEVCLLTSIGLEHTKFLGDTCAEIARAKGGIIKPGVPVVLQGQDDEVCRTIAAICEKTESPLVCTQPDKIEIKTCDVSGTEFSYKGTTYHLSLPGSYQALNAVQVIETIQILRQRGYVIPEPALRDGLAQTAWPGRFETIWRKPRIILDGAHNPDAAKRLRQALESDCSGRRIRMIMGVLADKNFDEVASLVAPLAEKIYTVTPDNPRALDAEALAETVRRYCPKVRAVTLEQAIRCTLQEAAADDVVLAFGSLSYLGRLRELLQNMGK
ncbi:MAG: dihydrofolate reductase [Eubacteriales bacterium]|nr:dihydrofolate reductase [Eubacteriales bacterium]